MVRTIDHSRQARVCSDPRSHRWADRSLACTLVTALLLSVAVSGCRPRAGAEAATAGGLAPVGATTTTGMSNAGQAVDVARRYAAAVASGNLGAARSLVHTPTAGHERLADAVGRQFDAYHRVRAAAVERIGEAAAKRLPMNDAGTFFADRMQACLEGERGVVEWRDDFPPDGTRRDLDVVHVGGRWRVSLSQFIVGDDGRELARDVLEGVGDVNSWTRDLRRIEREIRSGTLKTFEEISRAI